MATKVTTSKSYQEQFFTGLGNGWQHFTGLTSLKLLFEALQHADHFGENPRQATKELLVEIGSRVGNRFWHIYQYPLEAFAEITAPVSSVVYLAVKYFQTKLKKEEAESRELVVAPVPPSSKHQSILSALTLGLGVAVTMLFLRKISGIKRN